MIVDIFIPCFIDQIFPQIGFKMVKVLESIGCSVNYNQNQTCCGQPSFNAGLWKDCEPVAEKFLNDFDSDRFVVVPSASCVGFVKNSYPKIFKDSTSLTKVNLLKPRLFEFTEFLVDELNISNVNAVFEGAATYHDACSALRECGIKEAPRKLLSNVKGLELIEMEDVETCCGFGGTFSIKFEGISNGMLEQKLEAIENTGADYIISTDASCLMHMDAYIKKQGYTYKTLHIAEVLASN